MTPTPHSADLPAIRSPRSARPRRRRGLLCALALLAALLGSGTPSIAVADPALPPAPPASAQPSPPPSPTRWQTPPPAPTPVLPSPAPPATSPAPSDPTGTGAEDPDCGIRHISGCVAKAIDGFFQRVVDSALNPLLGLLSHTLLSTPDPGSLPRVGELWSSSWQMVLACYGLIVVAAGVLVMTYEMLQTRWTVRELVPRLVTGFVAGAMSMLIATQAISWANALATAIGGDALDPNSAAAALTELTATSPGSGLFAILLLNVLTVTITVLLITYVVRVAITIVLIVAAPLALMCHGLPHTEPIARWWWRAFGACLAIQVVQSLVLVTALRVFLSPGGFVFFAPTQTGIVNILVALALMTILVKIPFWLLSALKIGPGHSMAGSLIKGFIAYKTFGLIKGHSSGPTPRRAPPRPPSGMRSSGTASGEADPYTRVRATRDGQLMLPLPGVRRAKSARSQQPHTVPTAASPSQQRGQPNQRRGRQLSLPLWAPEPTPPVGRDGQYRLPITVARVPAVRRATPPSPAAPSHRGQLAFDFDPDPFKGNRALRSGQYPLPLEVRRGSATTPPTRSAPPPRGASLPASTPPSPPPAARPPGRQLRLPLPNLPVTSRARRSGGPKK